MLNNIYKLINETFTAEKEWRILLTKCKKSTIWTRRTNLLLQHGPDFDKNFGWDYISSLDSRILFCSYHHANDAVQLFIPNGCTAEALLYPITCLFHIFDLH